MSGFTYSNWNFKPFQVSRGLQSVEGVVVFAKDIAETGDLTLGECAAKTAGIGDPRWIEAAAE